MRIFDVVGVVFLPKTGNVFEGNISPDQLRCIISHTIMLGDEDDPDHLEQRGKKKLREICPEANESGAVLVCKVSPAETKYIRTFLEMIDERSTVTAEADDLDILNLQTLEIDDSSDGSDDIKRENRN